MTRPSVRPSRAFRPAEIRSSSLEPRALLTTGVLVGPQVAIPLTDPNAPSITPAPPAPSDPMVGPIAPMAMAAIDYDKWTGDEALQALDVLTPVGAYNVSDQGQLGGSALAYGSVFGQGDEGATQAAQHAYWSAQMALQYGNDTATAVGNIHETYGGNQTEQDRLGVCARDQWANDIGRKIAQQVAAEGYGATSSRDQRIKDLIAQNWINGNFMKSTDDPRIDEYGLREAEQARQAQQRAADEAAAGKLILPYYITP